MGKDQTKLERQRGSHTRIRLQRHGVARIIALALACALLLFAIASCADSTPPEVSEPPPESPSPSPTPPIVTHTVERPSPSPTPETALVPYDGVVEHLFFHPLMTYPELAYDGDSQEAGFDEYMVTVDEYKRMLQSIYDNGYVIVNLNDVWSEVTDDSGVSRMKRNTLMLPEGKKPIVLSYDDINYYQYLIENGFTHKLILGRDGEIWSYGLDPQGNEVISQDLDAITILEKFVRENPDFSPDGTLGCINLTGYEGILGYRTNTDVSNSSQEFEANRQREITRVKPIIDKLKSSGWYFASHSWGHINFAQKSFDAVKKDADKWMDEVGSLVGETQIIVYPHGARLDGGDVTQTGQAFKYYHSLGFRIFASVGFESYSKIKTDISAVICDRMHADGGTLRRNRSYYMKFYDAALVWDDVRPVNEKYPRMWSADSE